ncbi:MAG TPA: VLRF1 family aeRF1-type release factor [Dehalococcoidia bacterium]|nr:VLRF1 family aeRF1-type release factor [Dehalococcoidia bacterium]
MMINRQLIDRLRETTTTEGVLTATMKLDPQLAYDRDQATAKFKGAYARALREGDEEAAAVLERERDRVLDWLRDNKPEGRGLVIYSSEPIGLLEAVRLDVMVPSYVTAGPTPDTTALARVVDEYPRMAVVMLDGGDARIYAAEQGREKQTERHRSDLPNRHDQGGWSQARYERHVEFHHSKHLKEVTEALEKMYYERPFDRLALVGVDTATKEFEAMLPEPIRQRVIGHLTANFKQESDEEIMERVRELREEDERTSEAALVDRVRGLAETDDKGVLGLDETIEALVEGRVDTLVVADGVTGEGSACLDCDYLAVASFEKCPVCTSANVEQVDVIEAAVETAQRTGSRVDFVFGEAREMLVSRGGLGAILRYVVTPAG